ncbi:MAG: hypothetical protein IT378_12390 [Sandaracinaceae bacterium]|nr:hypothetical protein [Sandaracinaceae bacterium]
MSSEPAKISILEARLRVLAVSLEPALVFARALHLGLDDLGDMISVGYFAELKDRGLSWESIARRLGKSRRTVANLARQARSESPLIEPSRRIRLRRRIVQEIGREGPLTKALLRDALREAAPDELDLALEALLEQGTLEEDGDRYRLATALVDLVGDDFDLRLDSLRHFLDGLTHVVYRRFFGDPGPSLARVYTFRATPERLATLLAELEVSMREAAVAADAEADGRPDAHEVTLGLYAVERSQALPFRARR